MRLKNLVYLAFSLLFIGTIISIFIVRYTDNTTLRISSPLDAQILEDFETKTYLFNFPIDQLEELVIKRTLQSTLIFTKKMDYGSNRKVLNLTHPILQHSDLIKISDFVSRVLTLKQEALIPFTNKEEAFRQYGFDNPYMSLSAKTTQSDQTIDVLIGNKVEGREGLRYVYSSALNSISIISSTLSLLEKKYGYFYKFPTILEQPENLKLITLKGEISHVQAQIRKNGEHFELYKLPYLYIYAGQERQALNWEKIDTEEYLGYSQETFDLKIKNWLLNLSYEDSNLFYNRYEDGNYVEENAYMSLEFVTDSYIKNLHFYKLIFSDFYFARLEHQNFIFQPKKESYRFGLDILEAVSKTKQKEVME